MKKNSLIYLLLIIFILPTHLYNHSLEELLEDMKLYHYNCPLIFQGSEWRGHLGDLYQHSMWVYCAAHNLFDEKSPYTEGLTLTAEEKKAFYLTGLLHDIGKAGRKELFDKTHPKLSYEISYDANNKITTIAYRPDLEEHCKIGFETLAAHLLNPAQQASFSPRPYILKTQHDAPCNFQDLFSRLNIAEKEQKLIAILIGIHWSFGNVRQGLMTNENFLNKLTNLAAAINYEEGIVSEKLLRLAILINIADIKGLHPCCAEDTWLFPGAKINIPAVHHFYPPTPFIKFGVDPILGKDCLGLIAMESLIKTYREQMTSQAITLSNKLEFK